MRIAWLASAPSGSALARRLDLLACELRLIGHDVLGPEDREIAPDVVHAVVAGTALDLDASLDHAPLVVQVHESTPPEAIAPLAPKARVAIVPSKATGQRLAAAGAIGDWRLVRSGGPPVASHRRRAAATADVRVGWADAAAVRLARAAGVAGEGAFPIRSLEDVDLLVCSSDPAPEDTVAPVDAVATGISLAAATGGATAELVEELRCGWTFASTPEALRSLIRSLRDDSGALDHVRRSFHFPPGIEEEAWELERAHEDALRS